MTSTAAHYQREKDRWRLDGGVDTDGDELTMIVAFDSGLVVITVF